MSLCRLSDILQLYKIQYYIVFLFIFFGPLGLLGSGIGKQNTTEAGGKGWEDTKEPIL